jgi:branched-chain amino acid transport system permease protein
MMARIGRPAGAVTAVALLAIALPFVVNSYFVGVCFTLLVWVALTESWIVISGMTGYISLGHVVFVGIGAYVAALTWLTLPIWLILPLAGLTAAALAMLVGYPCLRVRGPYFVILTFGVSELVKYIVVNIEAALTVSGRVLFGAPGVETLYLIALGLAWVSVILALIVRESRFGAALRAIRDNEEAAETIGVAIGKLKAAAFVLSSIVPGMVGALLIMRSTYFEPLEAFNPQTSVLIVTMAVIGGSDRPFGPMLGVVFLVLLQELLWTNLPQLYMIVVGALLIAVVVWLPGGIYGRIQRMTMAAAR